jgi:hypothetical protein
MPLPDIDPYWLIEHASVDELLALVHARDEVRALCTRSTMPVPANEAERTEVHSAVTAGSTIPVRDEEVELLTAAPVHGPRSTEPIPRRSDTVVLAGVAKAR